MNKLIILIIICNAYADELIWDEKKLENLPLFSSVQSKNKKKETKQLLSDLSSKIKKELTVKVAAKPTTAHTSKPESKEKALDCPEPYIQKRLSHVYSQKDISCKKINLSLSASATISEAIEIISRLSGIDIFVDQNIKGSLGMHIFKDKSVSQILKHLLSMDCP